MVQSDSDLSKGSVEWTLLRLSVPTTWGMICLALVSAVDAWFISQLGVEALATTGIAVPLIQLMSSLGFGLSVGGSILLPEAIGGGAARAIKEIVVANFQVLTIANFLMAFFLWVFAEDLLSLIGASGSLKVSAVEYVRMSGLGFPLLGGLFFTNSIMRAHGDTFTPGVALTLAALGNGVADYFLVLGNYGFPRMGVVGAAFASAIGWAVALLYAAIVAFSRYRSTAWFWFKLPRFSALRCWPTLLSFGFSSAVTQVMLPLSSVLMAGVLSSYGTLPMAAYTLAGRVEALALMPALGIGNVLRIFIPYNAGAHEVGRLRRALRFGFTVSLVWALLCFVFFAIFGSAVVSVFDPTPAVASLTRVTLLILPLGLAGRLMVAMANASVTSLRRPQFGTLLALFNAFALALPCSYFGGRIGEELWSNPYLGFVVGQTVAGLVAIPLSIAATVRVAKKSFRAIQGNRY